MFKRGLASKFQDWKKKKNQETRFSLRYDTVVQVQTLKTGVF